MRLASADKLRVSLGIDDIADFTEAIKQALDEATPHLEARTGYTFAKGSRTDLFYIAKEPHLFRNTYTTETKEDLLIMVTPYIERAPGS